MPYCEAGDLVTVYTIKLIVFDQEWVWKIRKPPPIFESDVDRFSAICTLYTVCYHSKKADVKELMESEKWQLQTRHMGHVSDPECEKEGLIDAISSEGH